MRAPATHPKHQCMEEIRMREVVVREREGDKKARARRDEMMDRFFKTNNTR